MRDVATANICVLRSVYLYPQILSVVSINVCHTQNCTSALVSFMRIHHMQTHHIQAMCVLRFGVSRTCTGYTLL